MLQRAVASFADSFPRAILDMKIQRDKLRQYQKRITVITDRETAIAKECLRSGDKKRALLALRRKKYQESLLSKTDSQLAQLEILTGDVEFALVQKDVVFGLQQGTKVLQEIHKEMGGIDKVEQLMGETAEAQAYQKVSARRQVCSGCLPSANEQQEISEMLAGRMSNQDEDEVEDELAALEAQMSGAERPVGTSVELPTAPQKELPTAPRDDARAAKERARARAREQQEEEQAEPILA